MDRSAEDFSGSSDDNDDDIQASRHPFTEQLVGPPSAAWGRGQLTTNLDDNRDDDYSLNYGNYGPKAPVIVPGHGSCRSWQCGGSQLARESR